MNRSIGNHGAQAILRHINENVRIDGKDREKPIVIVEQICSTDWASLTFVGQRHVLDLRLEGAEAAVGAAAARLETGIATAEVPIAGQFVAEIAVTLGVSSAEAGADGTRRLRQSLRVEALVLRD